MLVLCLAAISTAVPLAIPVQQRPLTLVDGAAVRQPAPVAVPSAQSPPLSEEVRARFSGSRPSPLTVDAAASCRLSAGQ